MCSQKQIVRLFPYQSARFGLAMKYCVKICWKTTSNGQKQWESKYKRYGNVSMWNWAQDWIFGNVANERFSSTHLFNKIIWSEYKSNLANKWCVCVCVLTFTLWIERATWSDSQWLNESKNRKLSSVQNSMHTHFANERSMVKGR